MDASPHLSRKAAPFILYLIALLFLCGAAWQYLGVQHKLDTWQRAQATIIGFEKEEGVRSKNGRPRTVSYPLFRFLAADGQSHTVRGNVGSGSPAFKLGEKVEALYPPDAPEEAQLNSLMDLYFLCFILAGLGGAAAVGGGMLWVKLKQQTCSHGS